MKVTINKQLLVSIEEMEATRYTLMLFQMAYPEKIKINKSKVKGGIHIECWLLNEDKEPLYKDLCKHYKLFEVMFISNHCEKHYSSRIIPAFDLFYSPERCCG